ncbi:MAG: hypothetical protein WBP22_02650 [Candidatus Saccharimonas sp.]
MSFVISPRDYEEMAKALKAAGLDESKSRQVVDALFTNGHMLIDSRTYHEMYVSANTYGVPS